VEDFPPTVTDALTDGSLGEIGAADAVDSNGEGIMEADTVPDLKRARDGELRCLVYDNSVSASEPVMLDDAEDFAHENCLTMSATRTPLHPCMDFSCLYSGAHLLVDRLSRWFSSVPLPSSSAAADAPVDASNSSHGEPRGGSFTADMGSPGDVSRVARKTSVL
jgi:hypothetical protein